MTGEQKLQETFCRFDQIRLWIRNDKSFLNYLLVNPEMIERLFSAIDEIEDTYLILNIAHGTERSNTIEDDE